MKQPLIYPTGHDMTTNGRSAAGCRANELMVNHFFSTLSALFYSVCVARGKMVRFASVPLSCGSLAYISGE